MEATNRNGCPDLALLYDALKDKSLSMYDVADLFGVHRTTIHRWRESAAFRRFVAAIEDEVYERAAMAAVDDYALALEHYRYIVRDAEVDAHAKNNAAAKLIEEVNRRRAHRLEAARAMAGDNTESKAALVDKVLRVTRSAKPEPEKDVN